MDAQETRPSRLTEIETPATILAIVTAVSLAVGLVLIPVNFLGLFDAMDRGNDDDIVAAILWLPFNCLGFLGELLILWGSLRMRKGKSWGLGVTAAVLACIPCLTSPCVIVGIPLGIWCLVKLNDPEIRAQFR